MNVYCRVLVGIVAVIAALPSRAHAEVHRDAGNHFQLAIPDGWMHMTDAELTMMNKMAGQMGSGIRYDAGLRPQNTLPGSYPYVLIQIHRSRMSGASYDDIESALSRELNAPLQKVKEAMKDLVKDVAIGQLAVDRERNRVIMRAQLDTPWGKVQGISQGHLGSEGIVYIHSYALERDFEKYMPTFNQINDSVSFDDGYSFVPRSRSAAIWESAKTGAIGGAVVGALAGLVVFVVRKFAKTKPRTGKRGRDEMDQAELAE
jgi:hypothetical protein